jgi:small conductance mechanosensitive channel
MEAQLHTIDQIKTMAIDMGMKFGPKLVVAILMLVAGYLCGQWLGRMTAKALSGFHLDQPVRLLLVRTVRVLILGLFAIMALQNLGVELLPLIAGLGVAGAGIALAMQGVLGNAAAGLTIIFTRPYTVGNYISIVKEEGEVLEVGIFNTVLGHADLSRVVIPNRKITGEILHNYGRIRQLAVEVRVSYGADIPLALSLIGDVLAANSRVLKDPKGSASISRLADSSIVIGVGPWVGVPDYAAAGGEIYQAILDAFRSRNIAIPVPQREVRMLAA